MKALVVKNQGVLLTRLQLKRITFFTA